LSNGSATETLVYNAVGQRIETSGGVAGTVLYWYDEQAHLLGEYDGSGNLIEETVWLGDVPIAILLPSGSGVAIYYVHTDHLNTPRQVTRPADNAQMWTWFSDPFGTDAANSNPSGSGTFTYNLRFPGQVFDGQVGLHSNGFRDFDPATGRYVESDPIGLAGGSLSPYVYVRSNPLRYTDRLGLQEEEDDRDEEPTLPEQIARAAVDRVVDQIRHYDPNFRYATIAPPGYRYGRQDIDTLRDILRQYQSDSSCRINYGSTPAGRPFTRHYGAETGPVRNIPGSVIDHILNSSGGVPGANNTTVFYDAVNDVTVVVGQNGVVSARSGPPRAGDL
jgi:RHS repeat-associated protein